LLDASTTYVEHLRNKPSAPSTPVASTPSSPQLRSPSRHVMQTTSEFSETTPLLLAPQAIVDPSSIRTSVRASSAPNKKSTGNGHTTPMTNVPYSRSRPHSPSKLVSHDTHSHLHHSHHTHLKPLSMLPVVDFIEVLTNSPRICRLGLAGEHQHHHHQHDHEHHGEDDRMTNGRLSRRHSSIRLESEVDGHEYSTHHHSDGLGSSTIGRKRQIVSILVGLFSLTSFAKIDTVFRYRSSNWEL
jgi:hypothetical protein